MRKLEFQISCDLLQAECSALGQLMLTYAWCRFQWQYRREVRLDDILYFEFESVGSIWDSVKIHWILVNVEPLKKKLVLDWYSVHFHWNSLSLIQICIPRALAKWNTRQPIGWPNVGETWPRLHVVNHGDVKKDYITVEDERYIVQLLKVWRLKSLRYIEKRSIRKDFAWARKAI